MQPLIEEIELPEGLDAAAQAVSISAELAVYLRGWPEGSSTSYSILADRPFISIQGRGDRYTLSARRPEEQTGDPWGMTERLLALFSREDHNDYGFPMGGCFGYWGYHMKDLVEPTLLPTIRNDGPEREPDYALGFFGSLAVHDHALGKTWIISTGLAADGSRTLQRAQEEMERWKRLLRVSAGNRGSSRERLGPKLAIPEISREEFVRRVLRAQEYIRAGDIYQVNLSYALRAARRDPWNLFEALNSRSPAPFSAWLKSPGLEIASSSPEQFLRLSGSHVHTRPIKGTRPRSADPTRDAQLAYELQTSLKENAELVMITDLLRNDLGKVCEFGSVQVPEVARLERFSHVQHLVSTVEGRLRPDVSHLQALEACFPGGSITGAPKFRSMQIIDEIERAPRGCYTGALGYIGFNRESHLSIIIRTAVAWRENLLFNVGAGIVADSDPAAEYEETIAKAQGFFSALREVDAHEQKQIVTP